MDGVHVLFDARAEKVKRVEDALGAAQPDVVEESQTRHWFAYKLDNAPDSLSTSFGIFNTYTDVILEAQKGATLTTKTLKENAQLFEGEPRKHSMYLLATKLPDDCNAGRAPERGAQIIMKARTGFGSKLRSIITVS